MIGSVAHRRWLPLRLAARPLHGLRAPVSAFGLMLAAAILVPLGILLLGAWLTWAQVWRQTEAELARTADAAAEYAARLLDGHALLADRVDDLLRDLPDERIREQEHGLHQALRHMAETRSSVLTLYAIDAEGCPLVSANLFPVPRDGRLADRDFFEALRGGHSPGRYLSKMYVGRFDGQSFFSVARRRGAMALEAEEEAQPPALFRGVVLVSLRPGEVGAGLQRLASQPDDRIALVRTDGEILARSKGLERPTTPLPPGSPLLTAMARGDERAVMRIRSTLDGVERVAAASRVEGWPAYVSVARPRAAVIAAWRRAVALQAGLAGPAVLGLVGLIVLALRRSNAAVEARVSQRGEAERRRGAEALAESQVRLRLATEGAGLGIYEWDLARGLGRFDERAVAVLAGAYPAGVWLRLDSPEYAVGAPRVHPDDREARAAAIAAVVGGKAARMSLEYRVRRDDGGWAWVWAHATAMDPDPQTGRPRRVVGVLQDTTDRHRMTDELRQAQKLQALGELAGGIAHDFNNMLQAVAGGAALIERRAEDIPGVRRRARMLIQAAERGASITRRMLAFARRGELRMEAVDPGELLKSMRDILGPALGPGIELRLEMRGRLPPMLTDKGQLETAFINLATNARDAMPKGGRLILSAMAEQVIEGQPHLLAPGLLPGNYVRLAVSDTGEGMDAATLARVVEPFVTTKPPGKGTGLGLPMVKGFAEQSGGAFAIRSEPGRGTTVTLWFPEFTEDTPAAAAPVRPPSPAVRSGTPRVLVVDDEPAVRETVAAGLDAAGYRALVAANGAEALGLLAAGRAVDAMVTDLTMPGIDGLALIREARLRQPGLPVVLLTGYAGDTEALDLGITAGGPFALLRKPVTAADLASRLAELLEPGMA